MEENKSVYGNFGQQSPSLTPVIKKTPEVEAIIGTLSEVASNLRVLEDKYTGLRKKLQLTDQTLLDMQKNLYKERKLLTEEITESKLKIAELIDDLMNMKSELKDTVKQNDIKVLDRYLDFWEPLQYVTRKEVETLLDSIKEENSNNPQPNQPNKLPLRQIGKA